jgi:hypothetical protein
MTSKTTLQNVFSSLAVYLEILPDPLRVGGFGDHGAAHLQVPPQHHLSHRLLVLQQGTNVTPHLKGQTIQIFYVFMGQEFAPFSEYVSFPIFLVKF